MSEAAIKVQNLTKEYKLYSSNMNRLLDLLLPWSSRHKKFTALNNLSFEIKRGQHLGIIGKNGAGKSTLLKILTGVLSKTHGDVDVKGKIAALLELGAGFDREMTGRENIQFLTKINTYSTNNITQTIKDIIEFADIGDYIDQPVKNYSSGMFVRLAFAQAIMSSPEILIVDEALSVGDVFFQQKCIRRMQNFAKTGTIIFVSHDLNTMVKLCDRVIWLESGNVMMDGNPNEVISKYTSKLLENKGEEYKLTTNQNIEKKSKQTNQRAGIFADKEQIGPTDGEILNAQIINTEDQSNFFTSAQSAQLKVEISTTKSFDEITLGFSVKNRLGLEIFGTNTFDENCIIESSKGIKKTIEFNFTMPELQSGIYTMSLGFAEGNPTTFNQLHYIHDAIEFQIAKSNDRGVVFYHKMNETKSY